MHVLSHSPCLLPPGGQCPPGHSALPSGPEAPSGSVWRPSPFLQTPTAEWAGQRGRFWGWGWVDHEGQGSLCPQRWDRAQDCSFPERQPWERQIPQDPVFLFLSSQKGHLREARTSLSAPQQVHRGRKGPPAGNGTLPPGGSYSRWCLTHKFSQPRDPGTGVAPT